MGEGVKVWKVGSSLIAHGATWDFKPGATRDDYAKQYEENPIHAERDFGANPPQSVQAALTDKQLVERNVNKERVSPIDDEGGFKEWFKGDPSAEYFMHVDMSKSRDDTGMGVCHYDLESDKYVVDLIHTIKKTTDWTLSFERIFHIIMTLQGLGFNYKKVTFDSWQSYSTIERLVNKGIPAALYSVDRGTEAYDTLIETLLTNSLDYYYQATFIKEMKELKLYKGNKYDHPPKGSKDTSDGVAGCIANCVKARIGLSVSSTLVENAVHETHVLNIEPHRTVEGSSYHILDTTGLALEPYERNRKRVVRVDAHRDMLIFVMGWNDKLNTQLFVDEFLIWEDYTNQATLQYFQHFVSELLRVVTLDSFSLNATVPIEVVNFLRGTGRRVSSPLSSRTAGYRGANRVARSTDVNDSLIRMMVSQLKKGNLSIPHSPPLLKDLKYMTDDNRRDRAYVCALAGWNDFASREISFGRTGQSMPRPQATTAVAINPAVSQMSKSVPMQRSGSSAIDRIRAKYNQGAPPPSRPSKPSKPGHKRLPSIKTIRRR